MKRRMYLALERLFTRIEIRADELRELCLMRRLELIRARTVAGEGAPSRVVLDAGAKRAAGRL